MQNVVLLESLWSTRRGTISDGKMNVSRVEWCIFMVGHETSRASKSPCCRLMLTVLWASYAAVLTVTSAVLTVTSVVLTVTSAGWRSACDKRGASSHPLAHLVNMTSFSPLALIDRHDFGNRRARLRLTDCPYGLAAPQALLRCLHATALILRVSMFTKRCINLHTLQFKSLERRNQRLQRARWLMTGLHSLAPLARFSESWQRSDVTKSWNWPVSRSSATSCSVNEERGSWHSGEVRRGKERRREAKRTSWEDRRWASYLRG